MKSYEGLFIFPPEASADARKNQLAGLESLIQKSGGRILQKNELGKRPLGYALRKHREGYMISWDFEMPPAEQPAFRKALELYEEMLKFMILIKDLKREAAIQAKASKKPAVAPAVKAAAAS